MLLQTGTINTPEPGCSFPHPSVQGQTSQNFTSYSRSIIQALLCTCPATRLCQQQQDRWTALILLTQDSQQIFIPTADANSKSKRGLALTINMFLLAEIMQYLTKPFVLTCALERCLNFHFSSPLACQPRDRLAGQPLLPLAMLIIPAHFGPDLQAISSEKHLGQKETKKLTDMPGSIMTLASQGK